MDVFSDFVKNIWPKVRAANVIERLFRKVRRTKLIGYFEHLHNVLDVISDYIKFEIISKEGKINIIILKKIFF